MKIFFDDITSLFGSDKRQKLIKQLARENHWSFKARRNFAQDPIQSFDFRLFNDKSAKRLKSIVSFKVRALTGGFRIYDCHFVKGLGTKTTTVFEYFQKDMTLPAFMIQPKPGAGFFKNWFSEEDAPVILTATPDFLDNYHIATNDHFKLKENLTEEFLDRFGDDKDWSAEGNENCLIYYQYGDQVPPKMLLERLETFVYLVYDLENGKTFLR